MKKLLLTGAIFNLVISCGRARDPFDLILKTKRHQ